MAEIRNFLQKELKLDLHSDKSRIFPLYNGTGFLGFRVFYHHRLLKKSNIMHFKRRLKEFNLLKKKEAISQEKIDKSINSWMTYAE